jgi:hypothetical protein
MPTSGLVTVESLPQAREIVQVQGAPGGFETSPEVQAMRLRAQQAANENREMFEAALDDLANAVLDGIVAGS